MVAFAKSHGLGNDYIVMDGAALPFALSPENLRLICDRHVGIGSDGLLVKTPGEDADFAVRIYNPDGSEAEKSGNGIRIFARYLHDHGFTSADAFTIATRGGLVRVKLHVEHGEIVLITADMGRVTIDPRTTIELDGKPLDCTILSIGNPHCVVLHDDLGDGELLRLGPRIENHPVFPARTNVQLGRVLARDRIHIAIWERGAGKTLASGSSACAAAAACHHRGLVDEHITVEMEGGTLQVSVAASGDVRMTGPAEEVYRGTLSAAFLRRLGA